MKNSEISRRRMDQQTADSRRQTDQQTADSRRISGQRTADGSADGRRQTDQQTADGRRFSRQQTADGRTWPFASRTTTESNTMKLFQGTLSMKKPRGFHLITEEVLRALPDINQIRQGLCQIFIQHTSASLTLNEDAAPAVRRDFEMYFNKTVPENDPDYRHNDEGPDDMPAHLKASLLGSSVLIPITGGRLALGTWQGIYLCEHRDHGTTRHLVITAWGE